MAEEDEATLSPVEDDEAGPEERALSEGEASSVDDQAESWEAEVGPDELAEIAHDFIFGARGAVNLSHEPREKSRPSSRKPKAAQSAPSRQQGGKKGSGKKTSVSKDKPKPQQQQQQPRAPSGRKSDKVDKDLSGGEEGDGSEDDEEARQRANSKRRREADELETMMAPPRRFKRRAHPRKFFVAEPATVDNKRHK